MKPIVEVENLSKLYQLGSIGASSLREKSLKTSFFGKRRRTQLGHEIATEGRRRKTQIACPTRASARNPAHLFLGAERRFIFGQATGEVVGIVGRNGAGKSTLLKILSRITEPTSGRAILRGRVVSLLEVGTGFHPELTGRENIFLNGAILGMKRAEIAAKYDEIVEFSEVGKFIHTPVKRYSSGMFVRLAFAVAAHLDPEILLIDEVLAVGGYAGFQKKCLREKWAEVAAPNMGAPFSSSAIIWARSGRCAKRRSLSMAGASPCPANPAT